MRFVRVLVLPAATLLAGSGLMLAAASPAQAERYADSVADYTCPKPDGSFEYPNDRSKYIECRGNTATIRSCSSGLIWNRTGGYCDWPTSAGAAARRE